LSTRFHHGTWRVFLEEAAIRPHPSDYWLNPKIDDPERHAAEVREVCDLYAQARVGQAVPLDVHRAPVGGMNRSTIQPGCTSTLLKFSGFA
jgi:hypothetical protein